MLTLPIKKKWFDMIKNGIKLEEYREISPYYSSRFSKLWVNGETADRDERVVRLRNGYSSDSPTIEVSCTLSRHMGKTYWGALPKKDYYVLSIKNVKEV